MKVSTEDAGPCRKVMHIDVPPEAVAKDYEEIVSAYTSQAKLPGFRKAKAPAKIVEQRFRKRIEEDARSELVPRFYRTALQQEDIEPVAVVGVEHVTLSKEQGLQFDVTLDVAPQFKLPKYRKITIKAEKVEVNDTKVDEQVEGLRGRLSTYEDVSDRPVKENDLVNIDFNGTCDGVPVAELAEEAVSLGAGQDFSVLIGEPEYLPGIRDGLMGATLGEARSLNVSFPEDYHVAALAGKQAVYEIEVKSIRGQCLPAINEDFLKKLGMESEEALRTQIRSSLDEAAAEQDRTHLRNQIAKFLLDKTNFELPQSIVAQEVNLAAREMVRQIVSRGATKEQVTGQRDAIMGEATRASQDRVKLGYILTRIADAEDLHIGDSDVDTRIESLASQYRMSADQFRAELNKRNGVESIRNELRSDKTVDFLIGIAKIK